MAKASGLAESAKVGDVGPVGARHLGEGDSIALSPVTASGAIFSLVTEPS